MKIEDKYNMTREQNIFLAKRNIVDSIWKSSHIEGIEITYPETQKIYDGGNVAHLRIDEIQTVNNLKHSWIFILNSMGMENNLNLIKSINALVGSNLVDRAGNLRNYNVKIGGTNWKPELPNEEKINQDLKKIDKIENITDRAITYMCYIMRTQMFSDGNKRTAMLFANKIMIENGKGIISIPVEYDNIFGEKLTKYYESNDMTELKQWVYDECIDGIEYQKENNSDIINKVKVTEEVSSESEDEEEPEI